MFAKGHHETAQSQPVQLQGYRSESTSGMIQRSYQPGSQGRRTEAISVSKPELQQSVSRSSRSERPAETMPFERINERVQSSFPSDTGGFMTRSRTNTARSRPGSPVSRSESQSVEQCRKFRAGIRRRAVAPSAGNSRRVTEGVSYSWNINAIQSPKSRFVAACSTMLRTNL